MKTMTPLEVLTKLIDCAPGTQVFLSYLAGRKNDAPRAVQERHRAIDVEGISPRHYTGTLESLRVTAKGELLVTLWVNERDSVSSSGRLSHHGNYRAFNPSLGSVLTLEIIDRFNPSWWAL